ncbi:uncharacterized protein LOC112524928 [Cynara cardunculus var. scolymus]|uniref:uncharacterized protein LOC112524928 n=1 Tax=Cynara cardunculus var. scolymus TaxID=59895 RepID=UPI000D62A212|nr:uncharacterized protein LOC112524928 [Cynara cardunculus var. scolymus]
MATMLKNLTSGQGMQQAANTPVPTVLSVQCVCCGGEHLYEHCPHNFESINFVHNRSGPYTKNYNASWKQHPNFSWNSPCLNPLAPKQQGTSNFQPQQHASSSQNHHQNFQTGQPPFQNKPPPQADISSSLEAMIKGLFTHAQAQNQALITEQNSQNQSLFNQQSAAIRNLETQVSQLALNQTNRVLGTLPSNTEVLRALGKEHVKAVTLRSGKELTEKVQKASAPSLSKTDATTLVSTKERPVQPLEKQASEVSTFVPPRLDYPLLFPEVARKKPIEDEVIAGPKAKVVTPSEPQEGKNKTLGTLDSSCSTHSNKVSTKPVPPYVPFPQRLRNQKEELQFKKFLDVFKALHINIPLVEAIEQMPSYVKFLKDILSMKKKLSEYETVALTEGCSALLTNKIPPKLKNPGSFTIPCSIGGKEIGKALCDLGTSINLMPLSVFNTLGIREARSTTVTLQLANKSIAYPKGKIEDVLVQVDKFIFPADFIILDFEADKDIPIILGRPFLATGRTLIDVQKGELTMRL